MSWSSGKGREMNPPEVDAQSTHATGWINSTGPTMSLLDTFHSGGGPHAEDQLIKYVNENKLYNRTLCVYLTKSPCTRVERKGLPATGKGCAEDLEKFARENGMKFQFLVRNLYQPSIAKADLASLAAVEWLASTGRFAFSFDKKPRSNVGKALLIGFEKSAESADQDGFFAFPSPVENDFSEEFK